MPQHPGYEPYTMFWENVYHWSSPMVTPQGFYLTKARWAYRRLYNTVDIEQAVRDAAYPEDFIRRLAIIGPFEDIDMNGPLPIAWYNRRDFIEPYVNLVTSKPVIITTGL